MSALDVSIRAQIMNLLQEIQQQFGLTYLLIAHDLAVVKHMSNRIGVMYLGKLVETAESRELYRNPLHPYSEALYSAALPSHPDHQRDEIILPGEVPVLYGIASTYPAIQAELERLQNTETVVRIWGELRSRVQPVSGTMIDVDRFETVQATSAP